MFQYRNDCHSLRVSSVYIVDCSILKHSAEDYVNTRGLHSMFITVLYANTTAQQFPPHFRAFPSSVHEKLPRSLAVARLSLVFCLWFHQDIVIQLYLDNGILLIMYISYYIDDFLAFSFFFLTEFL